MHWVGRVNPANSLIETRPVSFFILLTTNLFESSYYFDLVEKLLESNICLSLLKSSSTSSALIS